VIGQAGAVHGKAGRRGVISDWMAMERTRGISITSAVLQFAYRDLVVNLLDTPATRISPRTPTGCSPRWTAR
jgi:peptide chain release factor 3